MSLPVLFTWLASVVIVLSINVILALRYGYRAAMLPLLLAFVPTILFFPFAFSAQNVHAVGIYEHRQILAHLPEAWFLFGSTGTVFALAVFIAMVQSRPGRRSVEPGFFERSVTKLIIDDTASLALFLAQALLFAVLIAAGFQYGAGTFSAFENTALRPVMNLANSLFSIGVTVSALRLMNRVTLFRIAILAVTLFMAGLSGQRAVTLIPMIAFGLIFLSVRSIKFSLWPVLLGLVLIPLSIVLSDYRSTVVQRTGSPSIARSVDQRSFGQKFVYGNQFSDVRDLAWILSGYDGNLLLGRSYIAGYTPFIPSSRWQYRRQWGFGDWTVRQAGLDPEHHSGLRAGLFSELYFNFGYVVALIGAVLTGLLVGRILRGEVEHDAMIADPTRRGATAFANYIKVGALLSTIFTPGFFGVPIILAVLVATDLAVRIGPAASPRAPAVRTHSRGIAPGRS